MENLSTADLTEFAWLVGVLFITALVLVMFLIIWGATTLSRYLRRKWRASVMDEAARMLAEERREVENHVARAELDIVQFREYELRPTEVPDYQRLDELTKDEAIDGMLAHTANEIAQAVLIAALQSEINDLQERLAQKERARARHWKTVQRMRKQLEASVLASTPITETEKYHHEETS